MVTTDISKSTQLNMELDARRILEILQDKGVENLYHANTVQTACTFLQSGRLMARGVVKEMGLHQTSQNSDKIDKKYNIWFDLFLDSVDIHDRIKRRNEYGPALFVFDLEALEQDWLPSLWVTKSNPIQWKDNERLTDRYFSSEDEFKQEHRYGEFKQMLVLRHCGGILPLDPYLKKVYLDNPQKKLGTVDLYSQAVGALKVSARISGMKNLIIQPYPCKPKCSCVSEYEKLSKSKLKKFFAPNFV
ncbi:MULTISPECIES: hypothetical protein [Trichocoleus]|uniref:Uncharacterized protein n=1 Tax=Trichocoleus desertorum GB2-A4 TaxID=2933944 RepID=A0ABV0JA55_9CYAN|nr:hypothetical protein [Trichocoleus sp. FACHB-46]MBD1861371.1 hypothetical protein [Trichocoleus sp. FACHB-46]